MENRNTHLAPGFTLNDLVPAPANVVVLPGPLGPLGDPHSLYQVSSQQGNRLSTCGLKNPGLHSAPGDSPFPPEHHQVSSCGVSGSALPLFIVLVEFKPSPFSLFSSVPAAVSTFPFSLQLLWRGAFPIFPPSPSSLLKQKQLPALCSFSPSSPLCHIPAEFCGSGCADCCVDPQISFLSVQDSLVLIWLYFMDTRCKKTSMLFHHLASSPSSITLIQCLCNQDFDNN